MKIKGVINDFNPMYKTMYFMAAAPAESRSSYSGSALPFANKEQALYNTPNTGQTTLSDIGEYEFEIKKPNTFYQDFSRDIVPPMVFVQYTDNKNIEKTRSITIDNKIPYNKFLNYPPNRNGPMYYQKKPSYHMSQFDQLLKK